MADSNPRSSPLPRNVRLETQKDSPLLSGKDKEILKYLNGDLRYLADRYFIIHILTGPPYESSHTTPLQVTKTCPLISRARCKPIIMLFAKRIGPLKTFLGANYTESADHRSTSGYIKL